MSEPDIMLGARLRAGRRNKSLTLRELASRVGVSAQLLSQIENGKTVPSVGTLKLVVTELELSMDDVFRAIDSAPAGRRSAAPPATSRVPRKTEELGGPVFRAGSLPELRMTGDVVLSQLPTRILGSSIESFVVTLPPGTASSTDGSLIRHGGTEICFVYEGTLTLKLGFQSHELAVGDVAAFDSSAPHVYVNNGDVPAKAWWQQTEPLGYDHWAPGQEQG
ncbi:cupin domain-containing protein [Streptomyces sp. NPDC091292]|uniref:cupin domain-containing protein n=1 Tax=Streptomyces sp. NPDC091292 TaxID=3365991 RepID=UPI00382C0E19